MERRVSVSTSKEPARIAGMFDAIAWRYDRLNHLLSAGLDKRWRRRAVRELRLTDGDRVIDVCSGTADLAIEAAGHERGPRAVVGVDFSGAMLSIGHDKIRRAGLASRVSLARGDAMALPFADAAFDAGTIGFGIRNVADPATASQANQAACRSRVASQAPSQTSAPVKAATRTTVAWAPRYPNNQNAGSTRTAVPGA